MLRTPSGEAASLWGRPSACGGLSGRHLLPSRFQVFDTLAQIGEIVVHIAPDNDLLGTAWRAGLTGEDRVQAAPLKA